MGERSHSENLYALLRNGQKRKFLGQGNMVVNSGSLLVKRCQQAKEMYGVIATPTPNHSKKGLRTENATIVRDGLSNGSGGCGMGSTNDGNEVRAGGAAQILPGTDGHRKRRCINHAQDQKGLATV